MAEKEKTEAEMAAEFEALAGADGSAEGGEAGKILEQDEIDSLLGGDSKDDKPREGNSILLDTSVVNYEKLPMLDHVFDKFERFLSTALRHFTADNVDVTITGSHSVRFGDYLNSIPLPAGLVVVKCEGLDDYIMVTYESQLIYAVVDILLGGRKSRPARIEGRNFTTIERSILDNLTEVVLSQLTEAFKPVGDNMKFTSERMEVNPRFAVIARDKNAALVYTVRVNLEGREGNMQFCLPYATLEPIRDKLLQQFMGEKLGHDNIWEHHLADELQVTKSRVDAILDEIEIPLKDVMNWRLGDTIELDARSTSPIKLQVGRVTKMLGTMGKTLDYKAVKVSHVVSDVNKAKAAGEDL